MFRNIRFSGLVGSLGNFYRTFFLSSFIINMFSLLHQKGVGLSGGGLVGGGELEKIVLCRCQT